jgi:hypothetical protein
MHIVAFGFVGALALTLWLRVVVPATSGQPVAFDSWTAKEIGLILLFGVIAAMLGLIGVGLGV